MHKNILPVFLISTLAACSGGDGDSSSASLITAAEGGTVALSGSETRIVFPGGALTMDTEITLELAPLSDYAEHENARSQVLVFDPEMDLQSAASLSVDLADIDPTSSVHIMQFVDGEWRRPEVSAVELGSGGVGATSLWRLSPTAVVVEAIADETGTVTGHVQHIYTQEPLADIPFTLWTKAEEQVDQVKSDASGDFVFVGAPVGALTVTMDIAPENNCYNDTTVKEAVVSAGQETDVQFAFVPAPC